MAPPPIITALEGTLVRESNWSEVTTRVPSTSNPGIDLGLEPLAKMILSPEITCLLSSEPEIFTFLPPANSPTPEKTVTLLLANSPSTPVVKVSITPCFRFMSCNMSNSGAPALTPYSSAWRTVRRTDAVSSNSLAGIQPT